MSFSIAGKTAIVTGAANGIGRAVGLRFAEAGANVMFVDMDEKRLKEELGERLDEGNISYFAGDLRKRLTLDNLLSATIDAFEEVNILVNASRQVILSEPLDRDDNSVEEALDQNLMIALRLSQLVANRMIKQAKDKEGDDKNRGAIVNLSSVAAHHTRPDLMAYSIASAALEQMTRSMAVALAPEGIRVNAVAMGSVMSASLQATLKEHPEYRKEIESITPMHRIAAAGELADTVRFLASGGASFMTGQVLTVDGGRTLLDPVGAPAH